MVRVMKIFKFFFVLLVGLSLAVSSCEKGGDGKGQTGSVVYGGKRIEMNVPVFEVVPGDQRVMGDRWGQSGDGRPSDNHYIVGVSSHSADEMAQVTSFYLFTSNIPREDFEFDLSPSLHSDFSCPVYFYANDKMYRTSLLFSAPVSYVPQTRGISSSSIWGIKSIGVDPDTGKEVFLPGWWDDGDPDSIEIPEMVQITGGKVKAKWGAEALRLEFDMAFADGKSAKGYGEIPGVIASGVPARGK